MEDEIYAGTEFGNELGRLTKKGIGKARDVYGIIKPHAPLIGATLALGVLGAGTALGQGCYPGEQYYSTYSGTGYVDLSWYYNEFLGIIYGWGQQVQGYIPPTQWGFQVPQVGPPSFYPPVPQGNPAGIPPMPWQ